MRHKLAGILSCALLFWGTVGSASTVQVATANSVYTTPAVWAWLFGGDPDRFVSVADDQNLPSNVSSATGPLPERPVRLSGYAWLLYNAFEVTINNPTDPTDVPVFTTPTTQNPETGSVILGRTWIPQVAESGGTSSAPPVLILAFESDGNPDPGPDVTAVPTPASGALLVLGLIAAPVVVRRQRRKLTD